MELYIEYKQRNKCIPVKCKINTITNFDAADEHFDNLYLVSNAQAEKKMKFKILRM
jgi:hypothetical protein